MISFRTFLEIAVDPSLELPSAGRVPRSSSSKIVQGESDPSQAVMTLVVHPKYMEMFRDLDGSVPWAHRQAVGVLERLLDQPQDGGLLAVGISNSEAASLKSHMDSIISDSEKMMGSGVSGGVKDEAMRWSAAANAILRSLRNAVGTANV